LRNAYEVLQVAESVSTEIVELVYKRLVFNEHPDRAKDKPKAEARLKDINWAFGVISDPEKRAAHDRELSASRSAPAAALVPKKRRKKKAVEAAPVQVQYIYVPVPVDRPSSRVPFAGRTRYESTVSIHHPSERDDDDSGISVSIHR